MVSAKKLAEAENLGLILHYHNRERIEDSTHSS